MSYTGVNPMHLCCCFQSRHKTNAKSDTMMLATSSVLLCGFFLLSSVDLSSSSSMAPTVSSSSHVVKIGALFEDDKIYQYSEVLQGAIQDINKSNVGVRLEQAIVLAASSNPADILSRVCSSAIVSNVSAIVAVASETSLFTLSMVGDILGLPIIGIGSRSFAFSNKDVHPMYLRLESSESFQSLAIKKLLERNGWFQFNILASDHVDSQAFVQYLTNITTSSRKWSIQNTVVFNKDIQDVHRMLDNMMETQTRVFVLHATPEYAAIVFEEALDYGLLEIGNVWIVTESVITSNPSYLKHYPTGLLAMNYVNEFDDVPAKIMDSVELLARASSKFTTNLDIESSRNCWIPPSKQTLEYGRLYYSSLLNTSFQGYAGLISLDEHGNLNNASYEILNLIKSQDFNADESFKWKKVGMWKNGDFFLESIIWPGNSANLPHGLNTEKIMVVLNEEKPFIFESSPLPDTFECLTGVLCLKADSTNREEIERAFEAYEAPTVQGNYSHMKKCCSGLAIDLLEKLSADVEFSYNLYLVADLNHGAIENGVWNGMVGDLLSGTADIAVSSFSITSERSRVIDFTSPFFHSGFSTLVAKKQLEPQLDSFLAPLDWTVWILVFVTVNIVAIAITVFEWMSPYGLHPGGRNRHYTFGLPSALNIAFSILFSHTVKSKPPKCMTSRFLLNVWGAFSFIFFASYTANLAAFMAGQTSHLQIDGINDEKLQQHNHLKFATQNGSSCENYISENWSSMAKYMEQFNVNGADVAIELLKSGELDAFIYDSPVIEYRMANDPECRLINVGKTFGEEGYGIGLPKGSPLKETLSIFILEYETDGYLEELQQKWFGTMNCYKESNIKSSSGIGDHKVRLAHVAGLFLMLLMGFGIGFLILLLEHLVYHYGVPRMQLHPEHKRNWLVLSQRLHRAANTEELIPCKANMQEVITLLKRAIYQNVSERTTSKKIYAPERFRLRSRINNHFQGSDRFHCMGAT
ncbi:glutamate receptor ionotropic, NMDA 3A-like isoform X2 [Ptychodera flava]|uniref:glutamate receptor ionotropic, NMDA 3A-like isoform X2 n=1 Tax=Ptychodera flava TaxID=63121 RepID=UPI003969FB37